MRSTSVFRPFLTPVAAAVFAAVLAGGSVHALAQEPAAPSPTPAVVAPPPPSAPPPRPTPPPLPRGPVPPVSVTPPAALAPIAAPATTAVAARPGARLAPGQPIPAADLEAFVDGAVREAMAAGHVAGVVVSVVQNGQVALEKGYGLARTRPQAAVDPDQTLFRLGSVSKTFTWLAVLKQAEAGRINLDQPVNAYLPVASRVPDENFPEPVKVRQLMDHSAGFEDRELGRLFVADPRAYLGLDASLQRRRPHRVRTAGELSDYSNYGVALAGAAVANNAGRPFEDMIETEVLRPMELGDTTFRQPYPETAGLPAPMPAAQVQRLSESFLWTARGRRLLPVELASLSPAVGASSSGADMSRYMLVLLGNGKTSLGEAYGPETARRIRTNLSRPAPGLDGWAYGFREQTLPGGFHGFGHDGATLGFRTALVVAPELGLGVFVAGNTDTAEGLTRRLPGLLVQRFYAASRLPPPADAAAVREAARGYTGLYLPTRRAYHGLEGLVGRLTRTMRVSVSSEGRLVLSQGRRARLFSPDGPAGQFRALYGEDRIAFAPAQGRARSVFLPGGQGAAERIEGLQRPEVLGLAAILALSASLLVLAGICIRGSREGRETRAQTQATWLEAASAVVWLAAAVAFGLWLRGADDAAHLMYRWPSPALVAGSSLALFATLLTLIQALMLRRVWVGERRIVGWSGGRKLRHTVTVLVYIALAVVLAAWGALAPWTS